MRKRLSNAKKPRPKNAIQGLLNSKDLEGSFGF
jgi:hypothetical protein